MKKFYFALGMALFCGARSSNAQGSFRPAITPETDYPTNNVPIRSDNTSAYSYSGINVGGNPTDLYVFTWDKFSAATPSGTGAGLAIRQSTPFAQSYNPPGFPVNDAASIEAAILYRNNTAYVLCSYYWISHQGFYVDLYHYLGGGVLQQVNGYPQNITAFGSADGLGWIHLDAHDLNEFVITWQEHGQILAKAGTASNNFIMGNTAALDNSSINMPRAMQPDVALVSSPQTHDSLMAHFVYTDTSTHWLVAATLHFDDILNTPAPLSTLSPLINDNQYNVHYFFDRPRIDAPDDFAYDDWSYAVQKTDTFTQQQLIYTGVMNNLLSTLFHFNLNDGSLNPALLDISPHTFSNLHDNYQPALAYDPIGREIYYCWNYYSNIDAPYPPLSDYAYIGLKIDNTGNLLMSSPIQYWRVQVNPANISPAPSIALSGQNTSAQLFMAFTQQQGTASGYYMTTKLNPWTLASFRPGQGTGIDNHALQNTVQVVPNPFSEDFQLYAKTSTNQTYRIQLTDALGRIILAQKGMIAELNHQLAQAGLGQLPAGNYFLKLWGSDVAAQNVNFKLLKTQ